MSDRSYYEERLDDVDLLKGAVNIRGQMAVPAGGKRRGGYLALDGEDECRKTFARLQSRSGFPNLRIIIADDDDVMDNVRWGEESPGPPTYYLRSARARYLVLEGRFYGYSEKVISSWCEHHYGPRLAKEALRP